MTTRRPCKILSLLALGLAVMLQGCKAVVLSPSGDVAAQQRDLLVLSTALMLVIILPVIALTVLFAVRYREKRSVAKATYTPEWDHSTKLELVIWSGPLLIVICLGALTWMGTHLLDPYRPLSRLGDGQRLLSNQTPLDVDVVALDWKWLFIYPQIGSQQEIATVNQLALPVGRPVNFHITAEGVMNSFYIPALAGQIYAMPGMETQLHAVANKAGMFKGFSANYSGAGFSGMHFAVSAVSADKFEEWTKTMTKAGGKLDQAAYLALAKPSENVAPMVFGTVEKGLYAAIVNQCVTRSAACGGAAMQMNMPAGKAMSAMARNQPATLQPDTDMTPLHGVGLTTPETRAALSRLPLSQLPLMDKLVTPSATITATTPISVTVSDVSATAVPSPTDAMPTPMKMPMNGQINGQMKMENPHVQ